MIWAICGLGNPGERFRRTRHNAGFAVIMELARRHNIALDGRMFAAWLGWGQILGNDALLVLPQTYMNRSGQSISSILKAYQDREPQLVLVYDDMDVGRGRVRIRAKGGSGGHLGCQSVAEALGTDEFARVRVGIGRPPSGIDPVDYVLEPLSEADYQELLTTCMLAADALECILSRGLDVAMSRYNAAVASP